MAVHCGVDIVEIDRLKDSIESLGDSFICRVFTEQEINYCEQRKIAKYQSYAARFAAKEAVSKAFGTGITDGLNWKDIEVRNNQWGKPDVVLSQRGQKLFADIGGKSISISMSHCKTYAVAYAVIEVK